MGNIFYDGIEIQEEYLEYLDSLRESGVTNMFGAAVYLSDECGLSKTNARKVLMFWMQTFSERHKGE